MTRAKSKPSIPTREPPRTRRGAASVETPRQGAASAPAAKAVGAAKSTASKVASKAALAKPPPAKAVLTRTLADSKAAKASPGTVGADKSVSKKLAPTRAASGKATLPKAAVLKAALPKAAVLKAALPKAAVLEAALPKRSALQPLDTPAKLRPIEQAVGVSSDAVLRRTGKSWAQWFALLDAAGAAEFDHKGIVAVLAQRHGVGPWWQQTVTVAYEQARGKTGKQAHEDGFRVDLVKTLELPVAKLYRLWSEPSERNKWLADDRFSIHKATAPKSIRARWGRGVSRIDVEFCEKGPSKSQVTVQHNRIESSDAAEQMKAYWAKKLSALEALLNTA